MICRKPICFVEVGILTILVAMLVGPFLAPDEFSWMHHSTSEQAGQGVAGAWLMRLGFVAFGLGVVVAAILDWSTRSWLRAALVVFGLGLIGTAIWSNASILDTYASDMNEDWRHSIASGVVGFGFAAACGARLFAPGGDRQDVLAWLGLVISVLIPLAMVQCPLFRGGLQRLMFVLSFVFISREFMAAKGEIGRKRPMH